MKTFLPSKPDRTITVMGLKVRHLDMLASNKNKNKSQEVLNSKILPECIGGLHEDEYKTLLLGDEFAIMAYICRETWGDILEYALVCPSCDQKTDFTIDISKMHMDPLPGEIEGLSWKDGDGREITWHLPTIEQKRRMLRDAKEQSQAHDKEYDFQLSFSVAMHIDEIKGVTDTEDAPLGREKIQLVRRFVLDQGVKWLQDFMDQKDEKDCGFDVTAEHVCSNGDCEEEFEADVPILDTFFSRPRKKKRGKPENMTKAHFLISSSESSPEVALPPLSVSPIPS